ncbi:hypothetical protein PLESTB_000523300 [Pleodorina starrii]|uniref:Uncharacterized protein n=1 Tax=Pleodorina starrii TaxID=330485 RepID=A0A9W6F0Z2_9CHLO|nr:hypothetical protein PLESTM_000386800 [Pleodorina starrii]GLC51631.1 hypothetical protein PLESTB_000523300 [Pleodorina starrii]GLC72400.1 hypothetical protein PLESTF_001243700 [Pleodorina starrii]
MAAATLLCSRAELVGATFDQCSGSVLVTVQGDGVQSYNLEQRQLGSLTLGSRSALEFQVASAQHSERAHDADQQQQRLGVVASVVHDRNAKSYSLCLSDPGSATRPISDAPSRLALPGPAQSCHILQQRQQTTAAGDSAAPRCLAAAVVLSDGRVGVTELGPDSAGQLHVPPSGQQPAPRTVLATSSQDTLLVAAQSAAGSPVTLRVLRLAPSTDGSGAGLTQAKTLTLACPGAGAAAAHAIPTGLTMTAAFALLQWSNGHATAVHGISGGAAAGAMRPCTFPLANTLLANGASTSASTAAAAPPPATASGRKRKNADAAATGGVRPRVLCAAVDDRQFVVLDLESAAAQSQVCFSLHDAQFGCPLSSGSLDLDAPLLNLDAAQCAVVAAGPEATIVRLGKAVHALHIRTQPVSLLSMVARLSVSATSAAAAAASAGTQAKPGSAGIGGSGVAKALVTLPAPVALDQGLLSAQAPDATAATGSSVAADDAQDVVLEPVPAAAVTRPEDICNSLIEQLSAAAAAAAPSPPPQSLLDSAVSYIAGRRQHGMAVPPQLLALTARGLAAAKQWSQLGTLLQHVPQAGLCGCSEVMVAVAAAQQYQLLSRLATCLDEVEPAALVTALQQLLAPSTSSNLAARQQYYRALRESAAKRVAEAEQAVAAAAAAARGGADRPAARSDGGGAAAAGGALALAQCAAAAVDGFSYREVLLHPVLAIPADAPAVQVALRRLSAPAADALLAYLAKWVIKYTGGAIGDMAAYVALPQELLFPYYHQVLEWTRMTMDSHLARLLMARAPLPALESLQAALTSAVEGSKRLIMLRGALEHVNTAAPLPAAHIAVATQYTAEVLDLRVR